MSDAFRRHLAHHMAVMLPKFGHQASNVRDFETPYGKLGLRQIEVLWHLRHADLPNGHTSPSQLAAHFGIQPSVMTRVLARLETNDLVRRTLDPADGRRCHIRITEKGVRASEAVEELFIQEMLDSMESLNEEEFEELRRSIGILDRVAANLQAHRQRRGTGNDV